MIRAATGFPLVVAPVKAYKTMPEKGASVGRSFPGSFVKGFHWYKLPLQSLPQACFCPRKNIIFFAQSIFHHPKTPSMQNHIHKNMFFLYYSCVDVYDIYN